MSAEPDQRLQNGQIRRYAFVTQGDNPGAKVIAMKGFFSRFAKWAGLSAEDQSDQRSAYVEACAKLVQDIDAALAAPSDDEGTTLAAALATFKASTETVVTPEQGAALDLATGLVARVPGTLPADSRAKFKTAIDSLIANEDPDVVDKNKAEPGEEDNEAKADLEEVLGKLSELDRKTVEAAMAAAKMPPEGEDEDPPAPASDDDEEEEEMSKEVAEKLKGMAATLKAQQDQIDTFESEKKRAGLVEKAKGLGIEGVDTEKLADAMEGKGDATSEVLAALGAQLKEANVRAALTAKVGSGNAPEGSAESEFSAKVSEIAARDDIGKPEATIKAAAAHPDLYEARKAEVAAAQ